MKILGVDSTATAASAAIYADGKLLAVDFSNTGLTHSQTLLPMIDNVLKTARLSVSDIDYFAVSNGPGSFTGVRIAVTIAKTIAYALSIPIRTIDALTILALGVEGDRKIVSLEDRNGAFVGVFNSNYNVIEPLQYMNKSCYNEFKLCNNVNTNVDINYENVYQYVMSLKELNPHEVKPLYIKGISAIDGK